MADPVMANTGAINDKSKADDIQSYALVTQSLVQSNRDAFLVKSEASAKDDFSALGGGSGAWWVMGTHVIPQRVIEEVDANVAACMKSLDPLLSYLIW